MIVVTILKNLDCISAQSHKNFHARFGAVKLLDGYE